MTGAGRGIVVVRSDANCSSSTGDYDTRPLSTCRSLEKSSLVAASSQSFGVVFLRNNFPRLLRGAVQFGRKCATACGRPDVTSSNAPTLLLFLSSIIKPSFFVRVAVVVVIAVNDARSFLFLMNMQRVRALCKYSSPASLSLYLSMMSVCPPAVGMAVEMCVDVCDDAKRS